MLRPRAVAYFYGSLRPRYLNQSSWGRPLLYAAGHNAGPQCRGFRAVNHRQLLYSWNTFRLWLRDPLFYFHIAGVAGLCGLFYWYNTDKVPISGRRRFNFVSEAWEQQLGHRLCRDIEDNADNQILPESSPEHKRVRRVFDRLLLHTQLSNRPWRISIIDNADTTNAFVLPDGSVFVYSGLVNRCSNDSELACVLGHEIAHNLARHGAESISRVLLWVPIFVLTCLASGIDPDLVVVAVDAGFKLPGSRVQEYEADHAGIRIMAEGEFEPTSALTWWKKMDELEPSERPEYLSTHPGHQHRLRDHHTWLVEARKCRLRSNKSSARERVASVDKVADRKTGDDDLRAYYLQRDVCGVA